MARGNQREQSREKNLKKKEKLKNGNDKRSGTSLEKTRANDREIMIAKQNASLEKKKIAAETGTDKK